MTKRFDNKLVTQFLKHDYHDRGMMKWQGFYLSDHTSVRAKEASIADVQLHRTHLAKMGSYDGITDKLFDIIHHKGAFYYGN
ncbi:hypothetical protein [Latilactobacillus sakei]|uniref:hypothetical protein n=1 Tax=Latilactobacillus sakei TaxID=1599 RepID=UPI000B9D7107|nr:hypothetical protein [Latilactobacillus sakei]BAX68182.1 hypothetical protein LASAK_00774 [Latilactobacillus sakei]